VISRAMDAGLCERCNHSEVISSANSRFVLCSLSRVDAAFPRYPRLPVLRCSGFSPENKEPDPEDPNS
jgi:hypothetical protein